MSFSQGSVILQQKRSAGGPVTNGARNGLNVVSGYVELGGGTSYPFLHNSDVDTNIYRFRLGDLDFVQNGSLFVMDDVNKNIYFNLSSGTRFYIDTANNTYKLGDISGALNGTKIIIDDSNANKKINITATNTVLSGSIDLPESSTMGLKFNGSLVFAQPLFSYIAMYAPAGNFYIFPQTGGSDLHMLFVNGAGSNGFEMFTSTRDISTIAASTSMSLQATSGGKIGLKTTSPTCEVEVAGSFAARQGSDIASANNLTLGTDGNSFEITGTTQINLIANTGRINGAIVNLVFTSNPTVKNGQATSGSNITILLAGAADFVASSNDVLTLMLCEVGGTQAWREVCRSVN